MFDPDDILEGARCIRFFLSDLVGAEATQLDRQLASLLAETQTDSAVQILELLRQRPATRHWLAEFLGSKRTAKGYEPLPGNGQPVAAHKYVCAAGDYVWYRRSTGVPVPVCPTHGELLPADTPLPADTL